MKKVFFVVAALLLSQAHAENTYDEYVDTTCSLQRQLSEMAYDASQRGISFRAFLKILDGYPVDSDTLLSIQHAFTYEKAGLSKEAMGDAVYEQCQIMAPR